MTTATSVDPQDFYDDPDVDPQGLRTLVAGLNAGSPLARRLLRRQPVGMEHLQSVPVMALMTTDSVDLRFTGPRSVPSLSIRGKLDALVVGDPDQMPYGIDRITLDPQESVEADVTYSFTVEQLQELVGKGLYHEGFGPPAEWSGLGMEFPAEVDIYVIPPTRQGEPPLVVTDLRQARFIETSLAHSGYKFEEAFPDHLAELRAAGLLDEHDMPTDEVSLSEVSGFDFGGGQDLLPVQVEAAGLDFDAEAVRRELAELGGHDFQAPDHLRLLRAEEQERIASGVGELARAGLGSREDEDLNRQFHSTMARRRAELQAEVSGLGGTRADVGRSDPSDDDLLAAFDDEDLDLGTGEQSLTPVEGFDFGDLDPGFDSGDVVEPVEPTDKAGAPIEPVVEDAASGPDAHLAELLGQEPDQRDESPELSQADAELLELDEDDPSLVDDELDSEQDKARKAALRARRAQMMRARRARERAARQAAAAEQLSSGPAGRAEPSRDKPDLGALEGKSTAEREQQSGRHRADSDEPELD